MTVRGRQVAFLIDFDEAFGEEVADVFVQQGAVCGTVIAAEEIGVEGVFEEVGLVKSVGYDATDHVERFLMNGAGRGFALLLR